MNTLTLLRKQLEIPQVLPMTVNTDKQVTVKVKKRWRQPESRCVNPDNKPNTYVSVPQPAKANQRF